jgi:hypothetical protein
MHHGRKKQPSIHAVLQELWRHSGENLRRLSALLNHPERTVRDWLTKDSQELHNIRQSNIQDILRAAEGTGRPSWRSYTRTRLARRLR